MPVIIIDRHVYANRRRTFCWEYSLFFIWTRMCYYYERRSVALYVRLCIIIRKGNAYTVIWMRAIKTIRNIIITCKRSLRWEFFFFKHICVYIHFTTRAVYSANKPYNMLSASSCVLCAGMDKTSINCLHVFQVYFIRVRKLLLDKNHENPQHFCKRKCNKTLKAKYLLQNTQSLTIEHEIFHLIFFVADTKKLLTSKKQKSFCNR